MSDAPDTQNVTTPNLALNKPLVGGDDDVWGGLLNANADTLDTAIATLRNEVLQLSGSLLFIGTYDVVADHAEFAAASGFPNGPLPPASGSNFNSYLIAINAGTGHGNAPAVQFNAGDWLVSDGSEWVRLALGIPPGGEVAAANVTVTPAVLGATDVQSALTQLNQAQGLYLLLDGTKQMTGPLVTTLGGSTAPGLQIGGPTAGIWSLGTSMFLNAGNATLLQLAPGAVTSQAPITLPADPTVNLQAATKQYVDTKVGSVPGGALISPVAPAATPGELWWDSTGGQLYVYYNDGNSSQFVPATNMQGLANAATQAQVAMAQNNVGRNVLHNPLFNIAQRGAGPFTAQAALTADRWKIDLTLDTVSITLPANTDAMRTAIGDESANFVLSNTFTGNAGATAYSAIHQAIEGVRRLSGKTVTVSFYAVAAAGTPKLGVSIYQIFGTGGSPSAAVGVNGQAVTLSSAAWARYSVTFAMPGAVGKTLGTNGDDSTQLYFWYSSGANNAVAAGSPGVQSGTINIWGVQLEIAQAGQTQPTPLEKPDPQQDLAKCQRFYQVIGSLNVNSYAVGAGIYAYGPISLLVQMRAVPTATPNWSGGVNVGSTGCVASFSAANPYIVSAAAGAFSGVVTLLLSADL